MKRASLVSSLLLLKLIVTSTAANSPYCSPSLCGSGRKHIGCGNDGAYGDKCPDSLIPFSNALKSKIVSSHNEKRNEIASGGIPQFQSATRMATMHWDDELANLAALNAKTCLFQHDQCHATDQYQWSGQNIARIWWSGSSISVDSKILELINNWWAEMADATQSDIDSFPSQSPKTIGHFTVMAAEKNAAVGCAAVRFPENNWNVLSLTCNYAWTNIINRSIYKSGSSASKCTTGTNPSYPALCGPSESYDFKNVE